MIKRIRNYFIIGMSSVFSGKVFAIASGFYIGAMGGTATNQATPQNAQLGNNSTVIVKPKSTQYGARGFVGYKFNSYTGMEAGVTYFSAIQYSGSAAACTSPQSRIVGGDVVGVGTLPIGNFGVFAKAGVAIINIFTSGAFYTPAPGNTCAGSQNNLRYRGTASIGASYDFNQTWVADISANRIMVAGIIGNVDFYALGISYHFVDLYCGQFLC